MTIKNNRGARQLITAILTQAARDVIDKPTKQAPYEREKAIIFFKSEWGALLVDNSTFKGYTSNQLLRKLERKMK